jgi:hypothetical protein
VVSTKSRLAAVIGGQEVSLLKHDEAVILTLEDKMEIGGSIIEFFTDPKFPHAPLSAKITSSDLTQANFPGTGLVEYRMEIKVKVERSPEWYTHWAMVAKILADDSKPGGMPRKVNAAVHYVDKVGSTPAHMMLLMGVIDTRLELETAEEVNAL